LNDSATTYQDAILRFLAEPQSHGGAKVERIDTHISHVFLAGERAYKLKKAVKLDFLDFSTVELRRKACERELELNRRSSPELYLAVEPITRDGDSFRIGGTGEAVDWLVVMKRFGQEDLFDHLAAEGKLTPQLINQLADRVAELHAKIEERPDLGSVEALISSIRKPFEALEKAPEAGLSLDVEEDLCERLLADVRRNADLIEARRKSGKVRYCHGDMHLANICLHDGEPTLFDCIEFDDAIACIDVLYDIAFPIMDLVSFDLPDLANLLMNRYLESSADYSGVGLLPLFLGARAAIRAMALAMTANDPESDKAHRAKNYLSLGRTFLRPATPRLVVVGGLSGTGKSVLARGLAPQIGAAPGAIMLRSDGIRKRLFGKRQEERLPEEAYEPEVSAKTYATLHEQAKTCLSQGLSVIADATFLREDGRGAIEAVAREAGAGFTGIWLEAPVETLMARVDARKADASDANSRIVARQTVENIGAMSWNEIRADRSPAEVLAEAMNLADSTD